MFSLFKILTLNTNTNSQRIFILDFGCYTFVGNFLMNPVLYKYTLQMYKNFENSYQNHEYVREKMEIKKKINITTKLQGRKQLQQR